MASLRPANMRRKWAIASLWLKLRLLFGTSLTWTSPRLISACEPSPPTVYRTLVTPGTLRASAAISATYSLVRAKAVPEGISTLIISCPRSSSGMNSEGMPRARTTAPTRATTPITRVTIRWRSAAPRIAR